MKILFNRFFQKPILAVEILTATFFIALLTLAMPLYTIQILMRYVSYGYDGTLITLTAGMLIALLLQICFRILRTKMAGAVNQEPNEALAREMLSIVSQAKAEYLEQMPKSRIQDALNSVQTIQNCYDAQALNSILDAPFSTLFIAAVYLLSPVLAMISLLGVVIALFVGWITIKKSQKNSEQLLKELSTHRSLNYSAVNALETVRAFRAVSFLFSEWDKQLKKISLLRYNLADNKELSQTLTMSGSSLSSVLLYAVGAAIVVQGDLTVGALIGANILAGRAYQTIAKFVQTISLLNKAKEAFKDIQLLRRFPLASTTGSALRKYQGQIEFQDMGFVYPNTKGPVFESVEFCLEPGKVLAVYGGNGTGKTTMAKLLVCLLEPKRGKILVDGVNLQQTAPSWWCRQIIYMPQEPVFLNGSLRENVLILNPDLDEARLNDILRATDLKNFFDKTSNGLDTIITDSGKNLPPGIKRRLSLARGLATDGQLAVLDEPTDAMDEKGVKAIYKIMNDMAKQGKTIVVFSNDSKILKGASLILDLNKKPKPELRNQQIN